MQALEKPRAPVSDEKRVELGREVANLFFAAEKRGMNAQQRIEFGEILCQLLNSMDLEDRHPISSRMADSENAPHSVILKMAQDEISIATPVLRQSGVLTDDDLVEISLSASVDHRLAMSQRENLSERVTDELMRNDEMPVMRAIAANPTAAISHEGFQNLGQHGAGDSELAQALATRINLPSEVAQAILSKLDVNAKSNLMEILADHGNAPDADKAVAKGTSAKSGDVNTSKRSQAKALSKQIDDGSKTLEEVALQLAQELRTKDLALVFSDISMLPETETLRAITDGDGELLALICRAFDMSFGVYAEVEKMRRAVLRLPPKSMDDQQSRYESVTVQSAQKSMRFVEIVASES